MGKKIKLNMAMPVIFLALSLASFASVDSHGFREVFRNAANQGGGNTIGVIVNAMYYGILAIYNGISQEAGKVFAVLMLFFTAFEVLFVILQNAQQLNVAGMFKSVMPKLVRNFLIIGYAALPLKYNSNLAMATSNMTGKINGTMFTFTVETLYNTFFKFGTFFFGNGNFQNFSPGQIADIFFGMPLEIFKSLLNFQTILAFPANIAKIIMAIVCLWIAAKIVGTFISNLFSALMLSTFSILSFVFLLMDATREIGQKAINTFVLQSVTVLMTVGMMGLGYQTIQLISTGTSLEKILSLGVMLMMIQQVTDNVTSIAQALTSGGGIGTSNADMFSGMAGSVGGILASGTMLGAEAYDKAKDNFMSGWNAKKEQGGADGEQATWLQKFGAGAKNTAKNSEAARFGRDIKDAYNVKKANAQYIADQLKKGKSFNSIMGEVKVMNESAKELKKAQRILEDYQRQSGRKGLNSTRAAALGASTLITALSGNLGKKGTLDSILSRIQNKNITPEKLSQAQKNVEMAAKQFEMAQQYFKQEKGEFDNSGSQYQANEGSRYSQDTEQNNANRENWTPDGNQSERTNSYRTESGSNAQNSGNSNNGQNNNSSSSNGQNSNGNNHNGNNNGSQNEGPHKENESWTNNGSQQGNGRTQAQGSNNNSNNFQNPDGNSRRNEARTDEVPRAKFSNQAQAGSERRIKLDTLQSGLKGVKEGNERLSGDSRVQTEWKNIKKNFGDLGSKLDNETGNGTVMGNKEVQQTNESGRGYKNVNNDENGNN